MQILPNEFMYVSIIYFSVQVNQPVPKFGHLSQYQTKFCGDDAVLFENFERIRIVFRSPETLCRNDVVGNVQAAFNADLQIVLRASYQYFIL